MTDRVLWLSGHPMPKEQQDALAHQLLLEDMKIVTVNVTFVAKGSEAWRQIRNLCADYHTNIVAGMFPAHIVAAAYRESIKFGGFQNLNAVAEYLMKEVDSADGEAAYEALRLAIYYKICLPVSVPAPAKEGEIRGGGFVFSHWETHNV